MRIYPATLGDETQVRPNLMKYDDRVPVSRATYMRMLIEKANQPEPEKPPSALARLLLRLGLTHGFSTSMSTK